MAVATLHHHHTGFSPLLNHQLKWSVQGCYGVNLRRSAGPVRAASTEAPPYRLFETIQAEPPPSEMETADPDFYRIGFARSFRAYGVEFREGPNGFGVFASKDVEPLRRSRTDWDLRLACLLLFSFDCEANFWQLYGDFLPSADDCTSLLLASKEELSELQDGNLAATMKEQHHRALKFWEKNWHTSVPLKIRRLAREPERFIWAVAIAQTRRINFQTRIGSLVKDLSMLIPYADMLNHSFRPNCFFHWRFKDRMLEVMINAGQRIRKGDEMTINYMNNKNDTLVKRYGFSSSTNPWDVIQFSGDSKIHLDSFLSVFDISGLPDEYYYNIEEPFVDGAVIAAARSLPTWSDGDIPPFPNEERKAARELQEECRKMLADFPTTAKEDKSILESNPQMRRTREAAILYRMNRKLYIEKVIKALDIYQR